MQGLFSRVFVSVLAFLTVSTLVAEANGYRILGVRSARATALGEAIVAWPDEPAATVFNPSGLADLDGVDANAQVAVCRAYIRHTATNGWVERNDDGWQAVPAAYVTSDLGTDWVVLGLGASMPNGLSSKWGDRSFARYVGTKSELNVAEMGPSVGLRLGRRVLAGAGVSYFRSNATFDGMVDAGLMAAAAGVPGAVPGMADRRRRIEGDGDGWGGQAGVILIPSDRQRVGIVFHLPFSIRYDGSMEVEGLMPRTDAETDIDFPAVAAVGYAFEPTPRLRLETDLDWTLWNSVDDIAIRSKSPGSPVLATMPEGLENTLTWKLGAQYKCNGNLALRAGYIYNQNATPEANWRPSLPDTDTHFFSLGFGYLVRGVTVDVALQAVHYETRSIDNNVDGNENTSSSSIDGTYRTWAPSVSLGLTYSF